MRNLRFFFARSVFFLFSSLSLTLLQISFRRCVCVHNNNKKMEFCDESKISSEANSKSDKMPRIFPTVPVVPKYHRPQSPFASFLMPIECQSSMKIFLLRYFLLLKIILPLKVNFFSRMQLYCGDGMVMWLFWVMCPDFF